MKVYDLSTQTQNEPIHRRWTPSHIGNTPELYLKKKLFRTYKKTPNTGEINTRRKSERPKKQRKTKEILGEGGGGLDGGKYLESGTNSRRSADVEDPSRQQFTEMDKQKRGRNLYKSRKAEGKSRNRTAQHSRHFIICVDLDFVAFFNFVPF